ncbi:MAG: hypothetical protein ABW170_00695 [Candidatus Thiodiazotropha sp. L084R]
MIRLHCTKKLLAKLPLREDDAHDRMDAGGRATQGALTKGKASVAEGRLPGVTRLLKSKRSSLYAVNDAPETPLSGWHANLLLLQRRQCVLFVHDTTRFPVFVPALKKADFAELDYWFADGFMNTLLKTGADDALMGRAQAALGPLACDNDCNRSVQGSMNRMAQDLEHKLWVKNGSVMDLAPYRTSVWLAERPCSVKGVKECIWPIEAMHKLLA